MQYLEHATISWLVPHEFARAHPIGWAGWKTYTLFSECFGGECCSARASKCREQRSHGVLHLPVWVELHLAVCDVDEADGQSQLQLSAADLGHVSAMHSRAQHMQLGFTHRALQAQEQPVIEMHWVVDAILVQDQCVAQSADLEQSMPIAAVARQSRDFEAHHNASAAHADFADQMLKTCAVFG